MNQCQEPGEDQEEVTGMVCEETDLKDGQMKEVTVGDLKVLLVRTRGQFSAVGSQCSHYNAPLAKGALVGNRVRCPFHGACFNVRTGDIEEYPGLDSLPSYKVKHICRGQHLRAIKCSFYRNDSRSAKNLVTLLGEMFCQLLPHVLRLLSLCLQN